MSMPSSAPPASTFDAVVFGAFRLFAKQRLLEKDGRRVELSGRALDLLVVLAERSGSVVSKRDLIKRVWPDGMVSEGNLRFHIGSLRRALGDDASSYVSNVQGRGYRLAVPCEYSNSDRPALPDQAEKVPYNLPRAAPRILGREHTIRALAAELLEKRIVTLVGPGGIGKTTVAGAVARALLTEFRGDICFVDLGPLNDPALVAGTAATALGYSIQSARSGAALARILAGRRVLIVLDCCEHVIDSAAPLAEILARRLPLVHILATSRESLRVEGEHTHRLFPLEVPPDAAHVSGAVACTFSAVQLFIDRASLAPGELAASDANARSVAEICRRLDGIPLAIELAAARMDTYGLAGISSMLNEHFQLFWHGRRTALPRHQTLSATLDWSYDLLSDYDRATLRSLAVFAGTFNLDAARAVVAAGEPTRGAVVDSLFNLASKSLLSVDSTRGMPRFRLLDITRVYLLEKLDRSGESPHVALRHAECYRKLLEAAEFGAKESGAVYGAACGAEIDNIRAALTWCFSDQGHAAAAVALAAAAAPFWLELSLMSECRRWAEAGIAALDAAHARGTRREMVLQNALCFSLVFTSGVDARARAALARSRELAEQHHDREHQLLALVGFATFSQRLEHFREALTFGQQAQVLVAKQAGGIANWAAENLLGTASFFLGRFDEALTHATRITSGAARGLRHPHLVRMGLDYAAEAGCIVAHTHLLRGQFDDALAMTNRAVAHAQEVDHPYSLCLTLTWSACPVSLALDDLDAAARWIDALKQHCRKYDIQSQYACAIGYEGLLAGHRGDVLGALALLRECVDGLGRLQYEMQHTFFLGCFAEMLAVVGESAEAMLAGQEALQRCERNEVFWCMPEVLRIRGEVFASPQIGDDAAAECHFRRALAMARDLGALRWELRAAVSLARLCMAQQRTAEAREILAPTCARIRQGLGARDARMALALLDRLHSELAVGS